MANEGQSPVQQPVSLQQQVAALEQRVKNLTERLSTSLFVPRISSKEFVIIGSNEKIRAALALSEDEKTVTFRLNAPNGKAFFTVTSRDEGGGDLFLTSPDSSVILKAAAASSFNPEGTYECHFMSKNGIVQVLPKNMQVLTGSFKPVVRLSVDENQIADLDFSSSDGRIVANLGGNQAEGGSLNLTSKTGFVNVRSDNTGNSFQIHTNQRGNFTIDYDINKTASVRLEDKNGDERLRILTSDATSMIELEASQIGSISLISGLEGSVIVMADSAEGGAASIDVTKKGSRLEVGKPGSSKKIVLDNTGSEPSMDIVDEGEFDESDDGTVKVRIGGGKVSPNDFRTCPTVVHGIDTRDHFIDVYCEVTHPSASQFRDAIVDCARKSAAAGVIVGVAVAVASEGSAASESFAAAVATFKVTFKQCLKIKGIEIAGELIPKIETEHRFGDWSGH